MPKERPDITWAEVTEQEILEANINKYSDEHIVNFYKDYDEPKYLYLEYKVIFSAVIQLLAQLIKGPLKVVDLCGGAGKASFAFKECAPESKVILVDLSEKMLDIAKIKAEKSNYTDINMVQCDAYSFLEQPGEYDIIIFSSAIHHFKDPVNLLNNASKHLSTNGIIITIADPNRLIKTKRYKMLEFLATDAANKKKIMQNIWQCKLFSDRETAAAGDDFDIAEYQTYLGIDDEQLAKDLKQEGLNVLAHLRYPAGERIFTRIMPYIGMCWAFSMIISRQKYNEIQRHNIRGAIKKNMPFKFNFM